MAFKTVSAAQDTTADSTITITCTLNDKYTIGLGAGSSTVDTARTMKGTGTNTLAYGLYSDSQRTVNWGQTIGEPSFSAGTGQSQTITIYGKVTAAQAAAAAADTYTDSITATVTY
jgi:spore coat protein U-like protein